jgi:hypothetical protein
VTKRKGFDVRGNDADFRGFSIKTMRAVTLAAMLVAASVAFATDRAQVEHGPPTITVYKSPACSCCREWVERLRSAGFQVVVRDTNDMGSVKRGFGIPEKLVACHTGFVEGYLVEGHVPPDMVLRLLVEKTHVRGLAVPGMPARAMGDSTGPAYDVVSFDASGRTRLVAHR